MSKKAMYAAVSDGDLDRVREVLDSDPDLLEEIVVVGETWLHLAASNDHIELMEYFVDEGLPVDGLVDDSDPPINEAAMDGSVETLQWFLDHGAAVNGHPDRVPPLVDAIHSGSVEKVELLLEAGSKTDFTWGELGYSPIPFAKSFGESHEEIVELLRDASGPDVDSFPTHRENLERYLETGYGEPEQLSLEGGDEKIDVCVIRQQGDDPRTILATVGMSTAPLVLPDDAPPGADEYRYAELTMLLPPDWPLDDRALTQDEYRWPVEWLQRLASYPHDTGTWLGKSRTYSNENPPEPLADNTDLSCFLAVLNQDRQEPVTKPDGSPVQFYSVYPIYEEEWQYVEEHDPAALLELFQEFDIPRVVDVDRPNVTTLV